MNEELVEGFRLSPQQRRLWELQNGLGSKITGRTRGLILIEGQLDPVLLQTAWNHITERHEIFRTTLETLPGIRMPLQAVAENTPLLWQIRDCSMLDAAAQTSFLETGWREEEPETAYQDGVTLVQLTKDRHALAIDVSASFIDEASLHNLLRELTQIYRGHLPDQEPMQYIDVSEWLNELLQDEDAETGRAYWQKTDPASFAPYRLPVPPFSRYEHPPIIHRLKRRLPLPFTSQVETFLLSCWYLLLWRLTGEPILTLGVYNNGRKYDELLDVMGPLAKYLPLQCRFDPQQSFRKLAVQVENTIQEADEWQEYFAWSLITAADNEAPPSLPFGFACIPPAPPENIGNALSFSLKWQESEGDYFPLKLTCTPIDDALHLTWTYDAQHLDKAAVERLAEQYLAILQRTSQAPDEQVGRIDILGAAEREQIVNEWNKTQTSYPDLQCVHHLFEAQAAHTPDAPAIVGENLTLSYHALNRQAEMVAQKLRSLAIGPETRVGLYLDRSPRLLIGLLGILKAGGAYVPLDPTLPASRIAYMLSDAKVTAVLTEEQLLEHLPPSHAIPYLCLSDNWQPKEMEPASTVGQEATLSNLAYVMYTSGSTGQPKGVMISHHSLSNYLHWVNDTLFDEAVHRLPVLNKLSFDASLKQLLAPLIQGRPVWLLSDEVVSQPADLWSQIREQKNVGINCVTSFWEVLLDTIDDPTAAALSQSLTHLFVGGEALNKHIVDKTFTRLPRLQMWNLYGPTEATANACASRLAPGEPVTIGRPLANTQLYILDSNQQLLPIGVPGELYIGGVGLARGYNNQPGLTAERFVPNPFTEVPSNEISGGGRLYYTGDRARYLPDGRIQFLGRNDHQIKIRGYRVELGEIEVTLQDMPPVRQCVCTLYEAPTGEKQLLAYITEDKEANSTIDTQAVKAFLKTRLPPYMLPASIILLDTLPLMPNGKIDRQALPLPSQIAAREKSQTFVAPRTPIEAALVIIWARVLGHPQIGVTHNFFELGGDSILSIRLISLLRQTFRLDLPIRALFEAPTVATFAQTILAYEQKPGQVQRVAQLLQQVETMPEEAVNEALLKRKKNNNP